MAPPLAAECGLGQKVSDPILVLQGPKPQSQQHSGPEKLIRGFIEVFRTFYRWSKGSEYILDLKRIMSGSVSLPLRLTKSPPPSMTRTWRRLRRQRDIPDTGDADSVIFRLPHSSSSFLSIVDRECMISEDVDP